MIKIQFSGLELYDNSNFTYSVPLDIHWQIANMIVTRLRCFGCIF